MASKRKVEKPVQPDTEVDNGPLESSDDCQTGAPIEHYRGERTPHGTTEDPGDIEQETLDARAPYNKTYGR